MGVSSGHCLLTFKIQLRDNFDKDHNYFSPAKHACSLQSARPACASLPAAALFSFLPCAAAPIDMKPINVWWLPFRAKREKSCMHDSSHCWEIPFNFKNLHGTWFTLLNKTFQLPGAIQYCNLAQITILWITFDCLFYEKIYFILTLSWFNPDPIQILQRINFSYPNSDPSLI